MSLTNNAAFYAVERGISRTFANEVRIATPYFPSISTVQRSNKADEAYAMLGRAPGMREWLGDRVYHQLRAAKFTLENKHFESSLAIERTDIEDDNLGWLETSMRMLGEEAAYHPDELLFSAMKAGESSECWDGQYFFDTDHVWGSSGTQSNILTYTTVNPAAVTPLEINKAFHLAMVRMLGFKKDNGKRWIRPKQNMLSGLRIACPLSLYSNAYKAFNTRIVEVSATEETDAVVMSRPEIDNIADLGTADGGSDTIMDVYYTGGMIKPYLFQLRQPLRQQTKRRGGDSDNDIEFKQVLHLTEARYNIGYLAWFHAVRVKFV